MKLLFYRETISILGNIATLEIIKNLSLYKSWKLFIYTCTYNIFRVNDNKFFLLRLGLETFSGI